MELGYTAAAITAPPVSKQTHRGSLIGHLPLISYVNKIFTPSSLTVN